MKISWELASQLKHGLQTARDRAVEEKANGTAVHLNSIIQLMNEAIYGQDDE